MADGQHPGKAVVPIVARDYGWHAGFALPAIGMLFGIVQFLATRHYLGSSGRSPSVTQRRSWLALGAFVAVIVLLVVLTVGGFVTFNPVTLSAAISWVVALLMGLYLLYMALLAGLDRQERSRVFAMLVLFVASTVFWMGYMQMFASFNLFAQQYTDRYIFGWKMPAGDMQVIDPLFVIALAPVFAALWVRLGRRGRDLSRSEERRVGKEC